MPERQQLVSPCTFAESTVANAQKFNTRLSFSLRGEVPGPIVHAPSRCIPSAAKRNVYGIYLKFLKIFFFLTPEALVFFPMCCRYIFCTLSVTNISWKCTALAESWEIEFFNETENWGGEFLSFNNPNYQPIVSD